MTVLLLLLIVISALLIGVGVALLSGSKRNRRSALTDTEQPPPIASPDSKD